MPRPPLLALAASIGLAVAAHAAPTPQQLCESAMELASAKYAHCRLNAESKYSRTLGAVTRTEALGKCSTKLGNTFTKATGKYGAACSATEPSSAFDDYLNQCSDDVAAAAGGAVLPDYTGCAANLATCESAWAAPLLKTGQTTAFGAGTDGDLELGASHGFLDNGDGTITDTKTGLMWEKKSDDGTIHDKDNAFSWSGGSYGSTNVLDGTAATTFLSLLNAGGGFAGHTDWRLPNRKELESLTNLEIAYPAPATFPAFDTGCGVIPSGNPGCSVTTCSCTTPDSYWSSSTYMAGPAFAWRVHFADGEATAVTKSSPSYVRAVRGGS